MAGEEVIVGCVWEALEKCNSGSAPGLDQVPYRVWKNIHRTNEKVIPRLVNDVLI